MIRRWSQSVPVPLAAAAALGVLAIAVVALGGSIDGTALRSAWDEAVADPLGVVVIALALLGAFTARALAWQRLLPQLGLGQSLAAIHLALGGNHVLPFRLGEPLRIASVARRTTVPVADATSTTVLLRTADMVTLALLGLVAAPGLVAEQLGGIGLVIVIGLCALGVAAILVIARQAGRSDRRIQLPGAGAFALVVSAWLAEAVVVWQVARWFDVALSPQQAVAVLAAAVSVQLVAIAPGGIGTYEAAATAALVASGVPAGTAVTMAVAIHAVKTIYSLAAGATALVAPRPAMVGTRPRQDDDPAHADRLVPTPVRSA